MPAARAASASAQAAASVRYYLLTASKDHIEKAVQLGMIRQRRPKRVEKLRPGDRLVLYASREVFGGRGGDCQRILAAGTVLDGPLELLKERKPSSSSAPPSSAKKIEAATAAGKKKAPAGSSDGDEEYSVWRRPASYVSLDNPIRPLLPRLSFVRDPARWGFAFMSGWREISAADFDVLTGGAAAAQADSAPAKGGKDPKKPAGGKRAGGSAGGAAGSVPAAKRARKT